MSEVAGRLAPQVGAYHLMRSAGGRGVLMGGVPGTAPAKVTVIGGGVSGINAAQIAAGTLRFTGDPERGQAFVDRFRLGPV